MQLSMITAAASAMQTSSASASVATDANSSSNDLKSTTLIESQHPRIVQLAQDITRTAQTQVQVAVMLHDWVRDEIAFGIPSGFYDTTATQTLDAKVGYCNTKVTLFQALLRAKSIPTRMRMMDLSAQVLHGLFDPGTQYVDHAIAEVWLNGNWVLVDSYVVDRRLASAAARRLSNTGALTGLGVHINGQSQWDGQSDNFIQCLNDGSIKNYVLRDHGVFTDVTDFYERVSAARNRKKFFNTLAIRIGASNINQQIQKVRNSFRGAF